MTTSHDDRRQRVEDACAELVLTGLPITFDDVAERAGLGERCFSPRGGPAFFLIISGGLVWSFLGVVGDVGCDAAAA
jgi:hypothetical protein